MLARVVQSLADFEAGAAGTAMFTNDRRTFMFKCPGCGEASALPLRNDQDTSRPGWKSTGPLERPTLAPSIHHAVQSCGWHGFLREGRFQPAAEGAEHE